MKREKPASKQPKLFDSDVIVTEIHQALWRDFKGAQHVHCLNDSVTLYGFNRQITDFTKKYCSPTQDMDSLVSETFEKFESINHHMQQVNQKLLTELPDTDLKRCLASMPRREKIHRRARALMHFVLGSFDEDEWFSECKNSGGSSLGVPFIDTSIESKFTFPMTATINAKRFFDRYKLYNFQLYRAIEDFNGENPTRDPYNIVKSSRATTVDKTTTKRRFICVEPTCNMFLQQGLMRMMYKRMKVVGLDVERLPDRHRQLAKDSSITRENATIDWSSASDCVSPELLRWLLPPAWNSLVSMLRCGSTMINGKEVQLHMVSTMGNAGTFPLETLVFWTYAMAVYLTETKSNSLFPEWEDLTKCSVFGDDCIVPTYMASEFMDVVESVGFIVNKEKSYYGSEQFRESCGGDYLAGYDIRPYMIKAPRNSKLSSLEPWLYIITNSLLKKYETYFGRLSYVYDKELWRYIFTLFRRYKINLKLVPSYFPDDAGLKLSHDILRFERHYPMKLSRIATSKHGTHAFNYMRFVYKTRVEKDGGIRFYEWLQKPVITELVIPKQRSIRRLGGYVVAKGISCHWHVPAV